MHGGQGEGGCATLSPLHPNTRPGPSQIKQIGLVLFHLVGIYRYSFVRRCEIGCYDHAKTTLIKWGMPVRSGPPALFEPHTKVGTSGKWVLQVSRNYDEQVDRGLRLHTEVVLTRVAPLGPQEGPLAHFGASGFAGVVSAVFSTPVDVVQYLGVSTRILG